MKRYIPALVIIMIFPLLQSCNNFGKEKDYDGVQLYHTPAITDSQADSLGKFLVDQKFADGAAKTVQITKAGNTYQFRFVVKDGAENDKQITKTINAFANSLSAGVFGHAPVEIDMCDESLKTKRAFPFTDFGTIKVFDGVQLYHTDKITAAETDSLGNLLIRESFADGKPKTVQITKTGNVYQFRFVIKQGLDKDPVYLQNAKVFAGELSQKVFNGAPAEIHLCDDYLNTLVVVK